MYSLRSVHVHSPVADLRGSPAEELLARESHQLLLDVQATLAGALCVSPEETPLQDPLHVAQHLADAVPQLSLVLKQDARHPGARVSRALLLRDFARLARHSHALGASPRVKAAFWLTLFRTTVVPNWVERVPTTWFAKPEFPQFVLDFRGLQHYDRHSAVDEALCDAVLEQLTTPPTAEQDPGTLSLGFDFRSRSFMEPLTVVQLQLVERMLDAIATHQQRRWSIRFLDFSKSIMHAAELTVLSRIVTKCKSGFYQVEHVILDAIIPPHGTPSYRPVDPPREFLVLAAAVFGADTATILVETSATATTSRGALHGRVSVRATQSLSLQ